VREDPREVGPLSGGVMSPGGSTPIRPVSGRRSLAPSSFTRRPMGCSCDSLSRAGRTTGLPRSVDVPRWGGSPLFAGGAASAPGEFGAPGPDHVPFWPERISILRSFSVTTFIAASRCVDPTTRSWSPTALMLAVAAWVRTSAALREEEDTLSRELSTPRCRKRTPRWDTAGRTTGAVGLSEVLSTDTSTTSCRTRTPKLSGLARRASHAAVPGMRRPDVPAGVRAGAKAGGLRFELVRCLK
jgi:hypothetical protein